MTFTIIWPLFGFLLVKLLSFHVGDCLDSRVDGNFLSLKNKKHLRIKKKKKEQETSAETRKSFSFVSFPS
jgi:hypothetical protein